MRLSVLFEQFRYSTKKINSKIYINTVTLEKWQKWKQTLRVVLYEISMKWVWHRRLWLFYFHRYGEKSCWYDVKSQGGGWYYFTFVWGEGIILLHCCLRGGDGTSSPLSWGKGWYYSIVVLGQGWGERRETSRVKSNPESCSSISKW